MNISDKSQVKTQTFQAFVFNPKTKRATKGWQYTSDNLIADDKTLATYVKSVGAAGLILEDHLAIDVDPRAGGTEGLLALSKDLGVDLAQHCQTVVRTGMDGYHYHYAFPLSLPAGAKIRAKLPQYKGVEFAAIQIIAPYSVIDRAWYEKKYEGQILPERVGEYYYIRGSVFSCNVLPLALWEKLVYSPSQISTHTAIDYPLEKLNALDPTDFREYDDWLKLMFSCQEAGLTLEDFQAWSKRDPDYASDAHQQSIAEKWGMSKGFGVTSLTLEYYFGQSGKTLGDVVDLTTAFTKKERSDEPEVEAAADRSHFDDWVYIEELGKFYNKTYQYFSTSTELALSLCHCLNGMKIKEALEMGCIKRYIKLIFQPHGGEAVVKDGGICYNVWTPPTLMPVKGDVTPFIEFMKHYWPQDWHYAVEWMAAIAQKKRPRYMLLVHSRYNQIGKSSIIGKIMRLICGLRNIVSLTEKQLRSDYNDYLVKAHLVVIEELYAGDRKLQFYNTLKEMITEPMIQINKKHVSSFELDNHSVYMAFTNYVDAMMISENDPRVLMLSTTKCRRTTAYYKEMHEWLTRIGHQNVYQYLLDYDLTDIDLTHAPATDAKKVMSETAKEQSELFFEEELLANPDYKAFMFVNFQLLRSRYKEGFKESRLRKILVGRGYQKIRVTIDKKTYKIYVSEDCEKRCGSMEMAQKYVRENWEEVKKAYSPF